MKGLVRRKAVLQVHRILKPSNIRPMTGHRVHESAYAVEEVREAPPRNGGGPPSHEYTTTPVGRRMSPGRGQRKSPHLGMRQGPSG